MDYNREIKKNEPFWSETRWNGCFNPDDGVGLFLHAGRQRGNLDWWWVQTVVYLPEGKIAVDRSWSRDPVSNVGVKTGSLDLRAQAEGWSAQFDGIVQISNASQLAKAPGGSSAPLAAVQFNVTADGSRPVWDMYSHISGERDFAGDMHIEQAGQSKGTLKIDDKTYRLDGVSFMDHSSGTRDFAHFHSHHFGFIVMPEYSIHAIGVYNHDGKARDVVGVRIEKNGKQTKLDRSQMPRLENVLGAPQRFDWLVESAVNGVETFKVELLHSFPETVTSKNDHINGIDWEITNFYANEDPLFFAEGLAKVTAPDGTVGYGQIERSNRRSSLLVSNNGEQQAAA